MRESSIVLAMREGALDNICTKEHLYEKIKSIRKNLSLIKYPYTAKSIVNILDKYNILSIHEEKFVSKNFSGLLIKNHAPDMSHIVINSNLDYKDKNFAIAHELIHFLCHSTENSFMCYPYTTKINDWREWQANEGAAELLLPHDIFIPEYLNGLTICSHDEVIEEMSENYNLSHTVIEYRLKNLQYEMNQYLCGISIDNIKIKSKNQLAKEAKENIKRANSEI